MASVRKHGPSWQIRWKQPDGTAATRGGFATKRAAEATAREVEDAVAAGRAWEPPRARRACDLHEIASAYIIDCGRRLEPITVKGYARIIQTFLTWLARADPALPASLLTRPTLLAFYDHLASTPARAGSAALAKARSKSTLVKRLWELHTWWQWAHDEDERWPGAIGSPKPLRFTAPARARVVAPTWAEMDACIAAAAGPQRWAAIVMRFTGLRVGQVMRLVWADVDLEAAVLTVRPELGKSKSERIGRVVPMSRHLVAEMSGWGVREGWVIPTYRKAGPRERTFRARDIGRAWGRAGVRPEAWRQPDHAFRKGFRSGLRQLGADSEAVEYLLGHRIGEGEEHTYTDPDCLPLRTAVDLIPPLGRPVRASMDTGWTRTIAGASSPEEKRRLRLASGRSGYAEGGTRTAARERDAEPSRVAVGGGRPPGTKADTRGPHEAPPDTGDGQGVDTP